MMTGGGGAIAGGGAGAATTTGAGRSATRGPTGGGLAAGATGRGGRFTKGPPRTSALNKALKLPGGASPGKRLVRPWALRVCVRRRSL